MRALIIATGDEPGIAPLNDRYPAPLLPLVDRPFIQHVIEFFANQGVTQFDFVLSHFPEKLEHYLGDGQRWGARFTYHLARDASRPYRLLKALHLESEASEPILFGHADRLPALSLAKARTAAAETLPLLVGWRESDNRPCRWTGWALLSAVQVAELPSEANEKKLTDHLTADGESSWFEIGRPLTMTNFAEILSSHQAVLGKEFSGTLLGGREIEPGIWLSRNVVLHPTALVFPPVYLGENCQVGRGVKLGPHAVVGHDCLLDEQSTVTQAVIFPGSYIGAGLELAEVLVDKNRLVNVRHGAAVTITDDFILGSMSERHLRRGLMRFVSQVMGVVAFVLASPALLLTALYLKMFRPGPVVYRKDVVRLPAPAEEWGWHGFALISFSPPAMPGKPEPFPPHGFQNFLLRFLPALVNIAKGELCFVGVPPRTVQEIKDLPHDWQSLYLHSKPGAVTEAAVRNASEAEEEQYAAEAFYTAAVGWGYDLKLLLRYLGRALFGWAWRRRVVDSAGES